MAELTVVGNWRLKWGVVRNGRRCRCREGNELLECGHWRTLLRTQRLRAGWPGRLDRLCGR